MAKWRRACAQSVLVFGLTVPGCVTVPRAAPCAGAHGDRENGIVVGEKGRRIDAFLERLALLQLFSGQVLIAQHDSVILNGAYGLADRDRCTPVTLMTTFDIASLSKQFTGAALLRLAQDGRLSLSDSLSRWLTGIASDKSAILLEQLAHHTSGIPRELDEEDSDHFGHDLAPARDSVVQAVLAKPLRFTPGSRYEYSNMGFVILAAVIEQAARQPFQDYVRNALLAPAGLTTTGFPSDTRRWPQSRAAHAYADLYDDGSARERPDSWRALGGSQIQTTASELLTWHRALRTGKVLNGDPRERVLRAGGPNYSLGWQAVRRSDTSSAGVVFHAGGHPRSFGSEFRFYPARDLVVIVLTNMRHDDVRMQEDVIANVSDYFTGGDSALTALPDVIEPLPHSPWVGSYALNKGDRLVVWQDAGSTLWIAPIGQRAFDAVYGSDSSHARSTTARDGAVALVDSLSRLRCPVTGALDPRIRTHELRTTYLGAHWCAWLKGGALSSHRVVGVAPRTYSKTRSLVVSSLRFGAVERIVSWEMNGASFIKGWSASDVALPQSRALGVLRDGRAVLYDWFTSRRVDVSFDGVGSLSLHAPGAVVTARRTLRP